MTTIYFLPTEIVKSSAKTFLENDSNKSFSLYCKSYDDFIKFEEYLEQCNAYFKDYVANLKEIYYKIGEREEGYDLDKYLEESLQKFYVEESDLHKYSKCTCDRCNEFDNKLLLITVENQNIEQCYVCCEYNKFVTFARGNNNMRAICECDFFVSYYVCIYCL